MDCQQEDLEALAADALLLLCNCSSMDPPSQVKNLRRPLDLPVPVMSLKVISSFSLRPWGVRSRRSSYVSKDKRDREEDGALPVIVAANCSRPSPATPLDFASASSDPSTSGSEGFHIFSHFSPTKRLRADEGSAVDTKVSAAVTTLKPFKRQGKRKSIAELQAQERSLMEEKTRLMKQVEFKRKDIEALMAENQRLKSGAACSQRPCAATKEGKSGFLLPDLNEPVALDSAGA